MASGKVRFFNGTYGFITEEGSGESYFFHARDIVGSEEEIKEKSVVIFYPTDCKKGPCAKNVVLMEEDLQNDYQSEDEAYLTFEFDDDDTEAYDCYDGEYGYEENGVYYEEDEDEEIDTSRFYNPPQNDRFVRIENLRLKISNILEYSAFEYEDGYEISYCIQIETYLTGTKTLCFEDEEERDSWLDHLDSEIEKFYSI